MSDGRLSEAEKKEIERAERHLQAEQAALSPRGQRIRLEARVTLRSQTNFFVGFSENISEGGIFISTQSPPDIGDEIDVEEDHMK